MFGIGLPELILIMIVGLIVFGPGKLPEVGRALGKGLREFKKAQNALTAAMNEPETPQQPAAATKAAQPAPVQSAVSEVASASAPAHPAFPTADAAAPTSSVAAQATSATETADAPQELHLEAKPTEVAADYHTPTQEDVRAQLAAQKNILDEKQEKSEPVAK